jgi:hypothetical protein
MAVEASIQIAWPLTEFSRFVDNSLTKGGFARRLEANLEGKTDDDWWDFYCHYTNPQRTSPHPKILYERAIQVKEIKNFAHFRELDTINRRNQTYVPVDILVERLRDSRFGDEIIGYTNGDDTVKFYRQGDLFRVSISLNTDIDKVFLEGIGRVLGVSGKALEEDEEELINTGDCRYHFIKGLKLTSEDVLQKSLELYNLEIPT